MGKHRAGAWRTPCQSGGGRGSPDVNTCMLVDNTVYTGYVWASTVQERAGHRAGVGGRGSPDNTVYTAYVWASTVQERVGHPAYSFTQYVPLHACHLTCMAPLTPPQCVTHRGTHPSLALSCHQFSTYWKQRVDQLIPSLSRSSCTHACIDSNQGWETSGSFNSDSKES